MIGGPTHTRPWMCVGCWRLLDVESRRRTVGVWCTVLSRPPSHVEVLVQIFPPFDIQHTKSPKNPSRTHALDCMGKV